MKKLLMKEGKEISKFQNTSQKVKNGCGKDKEKG